MTQQQLVFHDPKQCRCDIGECTCPCRECQAFRDRLAFLARQVSLEDRLKADGIDPQDLADLIASRIWKKIEDQIEVEAERLARRHLDALLTQYDTQEKLADLLFDAMVEVALGVQQGVKRNGRVTT